MSYEVKKGGGYKPMVITKENAISTGRFLSRMEFRKSEKANWLVIEVMDKDGGKARKSYFEPKMGNIIKTPEQLQKEINKFNGVIKSLIKSLLPDSYETGKVDSFEEFCLKIQKDIPESMFSKELRVKCVYDKNGNPTLPSFGVVFEDPTIPVEKSRIKLSERDIVDKVEMDKDVLPEEKSVTDIGTSDLPFDL